MAEAEEDTFAGLSDDVVLQILFDLEDDPRDWARLSCVCRRFSLLISTVCYRSRCLSSYPSISADLTLTNALLSPPPALPASASAWATLHKLSVCCPGLLHSGVLLDNSDFGLSRDIGLPSASPTWSSPSRSSSSSSSSSSIQQTSIIPVNDTDTNDGGGGGGGGGLRGGWSLYDDLFFDTVYNNSEEEPPQPQPQPQSQSQPQYNYQQEDDDSIDDNNNNTQMVMTNQGDTQCEHRKRRKLVNLKRGPHMAARGAQYSLSREQGNKLLASRFRGDCLYISDSPGCVHQGDRRKYMLFRGLFKGFKRSRVWRTINDGGGHKSRIPLPCAFCPCDHTWDLHSAFCLKRGVGFHDDGDPVVRAYVCENGHVSGAWTDVPLYT